MALLQIVVLTLVIFCVEIKAEGDIIEKLKTIDFGQMVEGAKVLYNYATDLYHFAKDLEAQSETRNNVKEIQDKVSQISKHLDTFESRIDTKLDAMLDTLFAEFEITPNLQNLKTKICECVNRIDHYFDKSREFQIGKSFDNDTLQRFGDSALWSGDNLPNLLENLHNIMVPSLNKPGFVSLMLNQNMMSRRTDCGITKSAQQRMYYTFTEVTMAEIKGLIALEQIYILQKMFDETSHNYKYELKIIREAFWRRIKTYYNIMYQDLKSFPRDIRQCHPKDLQYGNNFLEMVKFSRMIIFDQFYERHSCYDCPLYGQPVENFIYDCKVPDTNSIMTCIPNVESRRKYRYWKVDGDHMWSEKKTFGDQKTCPEGETKIDAPPCRSEFMCCNVCVCSQDKNSDGDTDSNAIWRISVTEQISDLYNNMVVTGVQLSYHNHTLHIKIKQGHFSHSGMINVNNKWKLLNMGYSTEKMQEVDNELLYVPMLHNRKTLYLDDIMVPEKCVITGVRFKLVNDTAFMLQVLATEFDFATDELIPYGSQWIDALSHPAMPKEYNRDRKKITMENSDDPTKVSDFQYDTGSNKMITFTHTDMEKDVGQTTIPLIDIQAVETQPAFPLAGIGLSFRGKHGYGGYISLRIYTVDIRGYIQMPSFLHGNQ